eukprot:scaffold50297_cov22-Tisochrysis_lutea.AAC.5
MRACVHAPSRLCETASACCSEGAEFMQQQQKGSAAAAGGNTRTQAVTTGSWLFSGCDAAGALTVLLPTKHARVHACTSGRAGHLPASASASPRETQTATMRACVSANANGATAH